MQAPTDYNPQEVAAMLLQRQMELDDAKAQAHGSVAALPDPAPPPLLAAPREAVLAPAPPVDPGTMHGVPAGLAPATPPVDYVPPPVVPLTSADSIAPDPMHSGARYEHDVNAATGQAKQALERTAAADLVGNQAQELAANARVQEDRRAQVTAEAEAAKQAELGKQQEAALNSEIDAHKQAYAADPSQWWANHGTTARIGAAISMIGAGLGGKDPNKIMFDLIDRDVAEARRKDDNLSRLGLLQKRSYDSGMGMSRDRIAADNSRKAAAMAIVSDELAARIASTADERTKATLMASKADIDGKRAQLLSAETHVRTDERLKVGALKQGEQKLALQGLQLQTTAGLLAQKRADLEANKWRPVQDWKGIGIPTTVTGKGYTELLASNDALYGFEKVQNKINELERKGLNVKNIAELEQLKSELEGTLRRYVGTGANLSPEEKANVDALSASFKNLAIGKVTGNDLRARIRMTQEFVANHLDHAINVYGRSGQRNMPAEGSPAWKILNQESGTQRVDEATMDAAAQQVAKVMNSPAISEQGKKLAVHAMAEQGNAAAIDLLREEMAARDDTDAQAMATAQMADFGGD